MSLTSYTIERRFSVEPERLFRAFTEPDDLAAWIWGAGAQDVRANLDLRPGGSLDISMKTGETDDRAGFRGVVLEVTPCRRLVHTVHWDSSVGYNESGMNPVDEVIVAEFEDESGGTLLRYTHHGIPDDGVSAKEHERSVRITLDDLARHVESQR